MDYHVWFSEIERYLVGVFITRKSYCLEALAEWTEGMLRDRSLVLLRDLEFLLVLSCLSLAVMASTPSSNTPMPRSVSVAGNVQKSLQVA